MFMLFWLIFILFQVTDCFSFSFNYNNLGKWWQNVYFEVNFYLNHIFFIYKRTALLVCLSYIY